MGNPKYYDSVDKILTGLNHLSHPSGVKVSDTLTRKFACRMCGWCCRLRFSKDYLEKEFVEFSKIYPDISKLFSKREVKGVTLYTMEEPNEWCSFWDSEHGGCKIHKMNPMSCDMEPIKVMSIKNKGIHLMKKPYGRGWQAKDDLGPAQCMFGPPTEIDQSSTLSTVRVLKKLLVWAEVFGINTPLPSIIDKIQPKEGRKQLSIF